MKMQSKLAAVVVTAAALGISGTAYAATTAAGDGANDRPSTNAPSAEERAGTVQAKLTAHRFAVVDGTGVLDRGRNAISANRISAGAYEVFFDRDVTSCTYVAVIGQLGTGTAASGEISVASRAGEPTAVFVDTNDSTGASADRPFHLTVTC